MGKHERQEIEEAEKVIVKILNSQPLSVSDRKNHWIDHALAIAAQLRSDFPRIVSARHLGNRYDNTGDILIISDKGEVFIEVKMSETRSGMGTKANISQDALTDNNLFIGRVKSWSDFRTEKKHDQWVDKYLDLFTRYPVSILKLPNLTARREEKARYLRELKQKGNKKAAVLLNSIHERDREEKKQYLACLSRLRQQSEMIKRFFVLITLGVHRQDGLKALMIKDDFFQEAQNLFVYYSNIQRGKVTIKKENSGHRIRKILTYFPTFQIIFPRDRTYCKIVGVKGKKSTPLLQIVLHWKNIAQGIKTPCLNIFDLTPKSI